MLRGLIALLSIALVFASSAAASEKPKEEGLKIGDPAPKFTLKDADDKEHGLEALLGKDKEHRKVIILMMGDRKVRKEANKWAIELDRIYGKNKEVALLMVADLRGLPFFVTEGMVKWGTKRENLPVPIVLDWDGKVNKLYNTKQSKPNVFIIDKDGKVSYQRVGKYSDKLTKEIQAKVQDDLKALTLQKTQK